MKLNTLIATNGGLGYVVEGNQYFDLDTHEVLPLPKKVVKVQEPAQTVMDFLEYGLAEYSVAYIGRVVVRAEVVSRKKVAITFNTGDSMELNYRDLIAGITLNRTVQCNIFRN